MGLRGLFAAFIVLLVAAVLAGCEAANVDVTSYQGKDLYWERYDVTIDIRRDGTLIITEDQSIRFISGPWQEGFAVIPLSRVEAINSVEVLESGQPYQRATSSGNPGTYTVERYGGEIDIRWWFGPAYDETRNFTIRYQVEGGLRVYDDRDQLWWRAIDEDFAADIRNATVTVNLPGPVEPDDLTYDAYERGIGDVVIEVVDADTLRYSATGLEQGDALEARVEFPKLTTATEPSWQAAQDAREEREARLEPFKALANLLFLGSGILITLGAPIGVYALWHARGRDHPVPMPVDILRDPPDDLPPGAVGTLIDEQADTHDLIAMMVDLGERGILEIEESNTEFLGLRFSRDWTLRRTGDTSGLSEPERSLISAIFGRKDEVQLKDIRQRFGRKQKSIKKDLYEELVRRGYFPSNPESVRSRWQGFGVAVLVGGVAIGATLWGTVGSFAPMLIALLIGLAVAGLSLIVASRAMPRKTRKGAEAAVKWVAFRNYLAEIEKHQDLEQAREIFSLYLPYAIAFGLEKSWVRKFARVDAPAPRWYGPHYGPRRYGRGAWVGGDTSPTGGDFDVPSAPSLNEMSSSFGESLQSMSDGLFDMFDTAADAFKPYSSKSGGSGGFSGGGGGFGGGGGGGGRGFS